MQDDKVRIFQKKQIEIQFYGLEGLSPHPFFHLIEQCLNICSATCYP